MTTDERVALAVSTMNKIRSAVYVDFRELTEAAKGSEVAFQLIEARIEQAVSIYCATAPEIT